MEIVGRTPLTYPWCTNNNDTVPRPLRISSIANRINPLLHILILVEEIEPVTRLIQLPAVKRYGYSVLEVFDFAFLSPKTFTQFGKRSVGIFEHRKARRGSCFCPRGFRLTTASTFTYMLWIHIYLLLTTLGG